MASISRESRLRALYRLLAYAIAESEELGAAPLDELLSAAAMAVSDELDKGGILLPQAANDGRRNRD
jgi:hypothetical protein